ncbi:peroxiredoxin [uncultured Sphingomonas sp.]|uniref:peroxiredoxin n=1 Tax=uncultured Sphingomonas sp. TaxID=158754 RepID=UPI0025D278EE|nr:peroxiredoxin [uncultured Sphingomonas sp.]
MRGLTIVVASADPARFDAALTLANAQSALGGRTRLYLHDAAVTLPLTGTLMDAARDLGVELIACQTALDTHGVPLPGGAEGGGMVGLLATMNDDRLVFA